MNSAILLLLVCLVLSYLERKGFKYGLKVSFVLIFIFSAIRYNYGNDFQSYLESYESIKGNDLILLLEVESHFEPGWILLCYLFSTFNFQYIVVLVSLLNAIIFYKLIVANVKKDFYWLAIFIFLITPNLFLIQLSTIRQNISIIIFIFSIKYLINKNIWKYSLTNLVGLGFHSSVFILFPIYFFASREYKLNKKSIFFIVASLFVLTFIVNDKLQPVINELKLLISSEYIIYEDKGKIGLGLGLIFYFVLLSVYLFVYNNVNGKDKKIYFNLSIISFLLIPFTLQLEILARLTYYFEVFTIVSFPIILTSMRSIFFKATFLGSIMIFKLYGFYEFFYSPITHDYYYIYRTIFDAI